MRLRRRGGLRARAGLSACWDQSSCLPGCRKLAVCDGTPKRPGPVVIWYIVPLWHSPAGVGAWCCIRNSLRISPRFHATASQQRQKGKIPCLPNTTLVPNLHSEPNHPSKRLGVSSPKPAPQTQRQWKKMLQRDVIICWGVS